MIIDTLIEKIKEKNNPTAVGLDTALSYLPAEIASKCIDYNEAAKQILDFNIKVIDEIYDVVPSVKVQIAYYEMYGQKGIKAFSETVKYAKSRNLIIIADAKRNDIGSTASCYSSAFLGKTAVGAGLLTAPFESDFLTVNGYLGTDGIEPFIKDCKGYNKGLFVLVKTSNPSSGEFQDKIFTDGRTLYETMGDSVASWGKDLVGKYGYSSVGAVVGATHRQQAENLRQRLPSVFFLIPGYGAQGGTAEDLSVCFDSRGIGGIVNSSRGILCAYKSEKYKGLSFAKAAREAAIDMKEDLNKAIVKS